MKSLFDMDNASDFEGGKKIFPDYLMFSHNTSRHFSDLLFFHIQLHSENSKKNILCKKVDNKQKLGISVGIQVPASSVAVIEVGDADKDIANLRK